MPLVTEGGYNFNPATGEFDFENADVKHDLANPGLVRLRIHLHCIARLIRLQIRSV